ncbi:hypothetical protein JCM19235_1286 [Vibrio maritimus]|uniref:Uncharacterized protein n=1 Tax=Vibrio maritimus TaxID=990268 RepID=A0A090S5M6_9VIBR|nr:hypothetical protein JCM19235_1286 [Vibrio maritimus]
MNCENIVHLQLRGYSFDEAKRIDTLGIQHTDFDALDRYEEEQDQLKEHQADLEERGFYHGTDCPVVNARIEAQEAFDDKYAMYMNEY